MVVININVTVVTKEFRLEIVRARLRYVRRKRPLRIVRDNTTAFSLSATLPAITQLLRHSNIEALLS